MTVSILGKNVLLIRPSKISKPIVGQAWKPSKCRCRTIKEHCGKVTEVCIRLTNGEIKSLPKGTHAQVCIEHNVSPQYVKSTGWKLDNGNYVWR